MENFDKDNPRIRQAQKTIENKVHALERSNYKSKQFTNDEMIRKIRKIIEAEVK